MLVIFSKDVVDGKESGDVGTRRVDVSIMGISGEDEIIKGSSEGSEKTKMDILIQEE
jgi:hypothetical protein